MIAELGPITAVLADADPEAKAKLYNELDLELTFHAEHRLVRVEAAPVYSGSCRRGTGPLPHSPAASRAATHRVKPGTASRAKVSIRAEPANHPRIGPTEPGPAKSPSRHLAADGRRVDVVTGRELLTAAGIGHWAPNELRHSFVSLLHAAGVPLERIADLVGHDGTRMTSGVYRHLVDPVVSHAVDPVNRMFGTGNP